MQVQTHCFVHKLLRQFWPRMILQNVGGNADTLHVHANLVPLDVRNFKAWLFCISNGLRLGLVETNLVVNSREVRFLWPRNTTATDGYLWQVEQTSSSLHRQERVVALGWCHPATSSHQGAAL